MAAEFKPFLEALSPKTAAAPVAAAFTAVPTSGIAPAPREPAGCGEVKVDLKRDGDRITQIVIHCRCGDTIEVACEY